jgi:hypothetical protein
MLLLKEQIDVWPDLSARPIGSLPGHLRMVKTEDRQKPADWTEGYA